MTIHANAALLAFQRGSVSADELKSAVTSWVAGESPDVLKGLTDAGVLSELDARELASETEKLERRKVTQAVPRAVVRTEIPEPVVVEQPKRRTASELSRAEREVYFDWYAIYYRIDDAVREKTFGILGFPPLVVLVVLSLCVLLFFLFPGSREVSN